MNSRPRRNEDLYLFLAATTIAAPGLVVVDAIESRLKADLRERESQWLLAGLGLVIVFGVAGVLAFSIARNTLEQALSGFAGLTGLGFYFLFRWTTRRQSQQILNFARELEPELLDARFTAIAGFVFIFKNGIYFQWYYATRVNLFIGFRTVYALAGDPLVPGIEEVGRWTGGFFWGRELSNVTWHSGPRDLRDRVQKLAKALGYEGGWISVQESRNQRSDHPEQAQWFVSCGFLGGRFWKNGVAIARQLEALKEMMDSARSAATTAHSWSNAE